MTYLPASRLEKIVVLLMRRLGTREILITPEEVILVEQQFPGAQLAHDYHSISDELIISIKGIDSLVVN